MKKLVLLILTIFLTMPAGATTLTGGVTYTVESARKEAFANVEYKLPQKLIDSNRIDPNFEENKRAIKKGESEFGDRYLTQFSAGGYGLVYKDNLYFEFNYASNGKIESIGKRSGLKCPVKLYKYNQQNELIQIALYVTLKENYIFEPNGQLIAHWIENKCYDINGNLIDTRY